MSQPQQSSQPQTSARPRIRPQVLTTRSLEKNNSDSGSKKSKRVGRWKKGQSGNPHGKPKGTISRFSIKQYEAELATGQKLPLQFMLDLMRDTKQEMQLRLSAATAAAPYLHRKMPIGIEQIPGRFGALTADQLRQLPTPALQQLLQASRTFYSQLVQLGIAQPQGEVIDVIPSA
jgi:hypothetical protein